MVELKGPDGLISHKDNLCDSTTAADTTVHKDILDNNNEIDFGKGRLNKMCTTNADVETTGSTKDVCKVNGKTEESVSKNGNCFKEKENESAFVKEEDTKNHANGVTRSEPPAQDENMCPTAMLSKCDNIPPADSNGCLKDEKQKDCNGKQKWKLKIRVAGANTKTNPASKWEVVTNNPTEDKNIVDVDNSEDDKNNKANGESNMEIDDDEENIDVEKVDIAAKTPLPEKRKIKRKSYDEEYYTIAFPSSKKSKAAGVTKSPAPAKPKGGLRSDCPPFCKTNCSYTHNPLLVFARRMIENDSQTTLVFLDHVADYYGGSNGDMKPTDLIHDPWRNTNFPLLHYIALMGKCSGCFAMIDAGHDPERVVTEDGDTVLHTLIKEMYVFNCTHGHMDILLKKFNLLLCEFNNCLVQVNNSGQTPMHLCAELIVNSSKLLTAAATGRSKPPFRLYQFQKNMMISLFEHCQIDLIESTIFNMKDKNGNTIGHYLANDRASVNLLETIKDLGADFLVCNKDGKSITEIMETAPPAPSSDLLELAEFSAKSKKYKSAVSKRPKYSPLTTSNKSVKTSPSRNKEIAATKRSERIATKAVITPKNIKEDLSKSQLSDDKVIIVSSAAVEKKVPSTTSTLTTSPTTNNVMTSSLKICPVSLKSSIKTPVVAILPKSGLSVSKPLQNSTATASSKINTNVVTQAKPVDFVTVTPGSTVKISNIAQKVPIPIKPALPNSTALDASPSMVMLPKTTSVGKPPLLTSLSARSQFTQKVTNSQPIFPPNIIATDPRKFAVGIMHSQQIPTSDRNLSQQMQRMMYPLNKPLMNTNMNIRPTNIETPLLMKTPDGKLMSVNVVTMNQPNQQSRNQMLPNIIRQPPHQPMHQSPRMFTNNGTMRMVVPQGFSLNPVQSPININGHWVYPSTSLAATVAQQMHFAQLITTQGRTRPTNPNNLPFQGHFTRPLPSQSKPIRPLTKGQALPPPQHISTSGAKPPEITDQTSLKKSQSLEASIQNIHSNLSGEQDTLDNTKKELPLTNPTEETAPPVFIIDTDDDLNNPSLEFTADDVTSKHSPLQCSGSSQDVKETEDKVVGERTNETPCKYQIEVSASFCQEFEKYLIQKRLSYKKLECVGHTDNNELWKNDAGENGVFDQSRINYLADSLKSWFRARETACLEEFSDRVLSQSPVYLSNLLNMRLLPTMAVEQEVWLKIESFLQDEIQQEEFLGFSRRESSQTHDNREDGFLTQTEINELAEKLKDWLQQHPFVSQATFARKILDRSQGTVSNLIRWKTVPISRFGEAVWLKIKHFLEDSNLQETLLKSCRSGWDGEKDVRIMENRVDHTFPSMARSNSFSLFEIISTLNGLTAWLRGHPDVSHSDFAERVMYSSVELLNGILERRCMAPPEYLFIIQNFLNDSKQQEQLLLYVKSNSSNGSNAYESSTIKFEVPRYQQKSPFTTSNFMKKSPSHYNYDDVILEELSEWFRRNPFVTHLEFVKTILKISSDEEEERVDGSDGDFLSRNFYDGFTEEGKKLLPYIKEFLSDEDQQNALRRSCIKESYKDLYGATMTTLANSIEKTAKPTLDHKEVSGLSNQLRDWLQRHPSVSQSAFAKKVLERSQGTMSNLLRWRTVPISKQGEGVWLKIKHFFENTELQEKLVRSCADQEEKGAGIYYPPQQSGSSSTTTTMQERDSSSLSPPAAKKPSLELIEYPLPFGESPPLFDQAEVNALADQLRDWLHRYPNISQVRFAKHVLERTQGTLSQLLKLRTVPTSKMGEKVWLKIKDFLTDSRQQDVLLNECGGPNKIKECLCHSNNSGDDGVATPSFCVDETMDTHTSTNDVVDSSLAESTLTIKPDTLKAPSTTAKPDEDFVLDKPTIDMLADKLKLWLENHAFMSQGYFAKKVLSRSQGTLSALLKWRGLPTSRPGHEVWYKIKSFLEDSKQQNALLAAHKQSKIHGYAEENIPNPSGIDVSPDAPNTMPTNVIPQTARLTQADVNSISNGLKQWLYANPSVSQAMFSKKVIRRQQGTLSELLRTSIVPRSANGEEVWLKIRHFLQDEMQQRQLLDFCKHPSDEVAEKGVTRWTRKELSMLDEYFIRTKGLPQENEMEVLVNTFEKTKEQVSDWFSNHCQREKEGLYRPGMYSIPQPSDCSKTDSNDQNTNF